MPIYRATVWHVSSSAQAVGDPGERKIVQMLALNRENFKALYQDQYLSDVDADITFGPITEKSDAQPLPFGHTPSRRAW